MVTKLKIVIIILILVIFGISFYFLSGYKSPQISKTREEKVTKIPKEIPLPPEIPSHFISFSCSVDIEEEEGECVAGKDLSYDGRPVRFIEMFAFTSLPFNKVYSFYLNESSKYGWVFIKENPTSKRSVIFFPNGIKVWKSLRLDFKYKNCTEKDEERCIPYMKVFLSEYAHKINKSAVSQRNYTYIEIICKKYSNIELKSKPCNLPEGKELDSFIKPIIENVEKESKLFECWESLLDLHNVYLLSKPIENIKREKNIIENQLYNMGIPKYLIYSHSYTSDFFGNCFIISVKKDFVFNNITFTSLSINFCENSAKIFVTAHTYMYLR